MKSSQDQINAALELLKGSGSKTTDSGYGVYEVGNGVVRRITDAPKQPQKN
jgi:hypothetical protein